MLPPFSRIPPRSVSTTILGARRHRGRTGALSIAAALVVAHSAGAQTADRGAALAGRPDATDGIARTFELREREGQTRRLDDGYRRHLDWHAGAGERWPWYLWEVANGPRAGLYVDGTFGHAWADFDRAVDPPGDGADNAVNVDPFAVRFANHVWRLRPELGGPPVDPEGAPFVLRTQYRIRPGADAEFTTALGQLRAALGSHPFAVHELVSGGETPAYVVWVPASTWAEAGALLDRAAVATHALSAFAVAADVELWRFRPDLSLCRSTVTRCHRTLRLP